MAFLNLPSKSRGEILGPWGEVQCIVRSLQEVYKSALWQPGAIWTNLSHPYSAMHALTPSLTRSFWWGGRGGHFPFPPCKKPRQLKYIPIVSLPLGELASLLEQQGEERHDMQRERAGAGGLLRQPFTMLRAPPLTCTTVVTCTGKGRC